MTVNETNIHFRPLIVSYRKPWHDMTWHDKICFDSRENQRFMRKTLYLTKNL